MLHCGYVQSDCGRLADGRFIEARCATGTGFDLVSDYIAAEEAAPAGAMTPAFAAFQTFFLSKAQTLSETPRLTQALALATAFDSPVFAAASRHISSPVLQLVNKTSRKSFV